MFQSSMGFSGTTNHRLNGSSSPVLTTTCLSYGSLWLSYFFSRTNLQVRRPNRSSRKMAQMTWIHTQMWLFWGKNRNFLKPQTHRPPNPPIASGNQYAREVSRPLHRPNAFYSNVLFLFWQSYCPKFGGFLFFGTQCISGRYSSLH